MGIRFIYYVLVLYIAACNSGYYVHNTYTNRVAQYFKFLTTSPSSCIHRIHMASQHVHCVFSFQVKFAIRFNQTEMLFPIGVTSSSVMKHNTLCERNSGHEIVHINITSTLSLLIALI